MNVYVTGQRSFGAAAVRAITDAGHRVVGVSAPLTDAAGRDDRLHAYAYATGIPVTEALSPGLVDGADVLIAAHSHAYVGRRTRAAVPLALGYHPSLLPLHRGRDAVRWAARDRDRVVGGSVYHLTDTVDGGPLAAQDYRVVPPMTASDLWRDVLFGMGLTLIVRVLADVAAGVIVSVPQDEAAATWEPSWERPPLHRPELPELAAANGRRWTADPARLRGIAFSRG